ncbi:CNH domain-containing protein [Obelidium mucronatum]|nr:CNH domain-containing protein [Obelidium mucronatum]
MMASHHQSSVEIPARNTSLELLSDLSLNAPVRPEEASNSDWKSLIDVLPMGSKAQKRMFHIDEVIGNQTNFVASLNALYENYYEPLVTLDIIDSSTRWDFIFNVFGPLTDLITVSRQLLSSLQDQQNTFVVTHTGDNGEQSNAEELTEAVQQDLLIGSTFLQHSEGFRVFEFYAANNEAARDAYMAEKRRNPKFANFISLQMSSSKKAQEPIGDLTYIIRRFSDYKSNLEKVLERTDEYMVDFVDIKKAIAEISLIATRMNDAAKVTQNQRRLQYLERSTAPGESLKLLNLLHPSRELIYQTTLTYVKPSGRTHSVDLILFDNFLAMFLKLTEKDAEDDEPVSPTPSSKKYLYKVYKQPMHVDNVTVQFPNSVMGRTNTVESSSSTGTVAHLIARTTTGTSTASSDTKKTFYIQDSVMLVAIQAPPHHFTVEVETLREQWKKKIEGHQHVRNSKTPFTNTIVMEASNRVGRFVDATVFTDSEGKERLMVATQTAAYLGLSSGSRGGLGTKYSLIDSPIMSVGERITQVDVLEKFDLLLVLTAEGVLFSYSLKAVLSNNRSQAGNRHKIASHVSFFKIGVCDDKVLICAVGDTGLRWQMKLLDPASKVKKSFFSTSQSHEMHVYKDIFIPTPVTCIDFLKVRVVIGTCRGFEMVHMKLIGADGNSPLLDSTDQNLKFIRNREDLNPLGLFRLNDSQFLLCFQDQGFAITKNGKLAVGSVGFYWRNLLPTQFAHFSPYILAVSRHAIDVFHDLNGDLVQSIPVEGGARILDVKDSCMYVLVGEGRGIAHISCIALRS